MFDIICKAGEQPSVEKTIVFSSGDGGGKLPTRGRRRARWLMVGTKEAQAVPVSDPGTEQAKTRLDPPVPRHRIGSYSPQIMFRYEDALQ